MRVQIPSPCHENWRAMTPALQGRHCGACAKTVVDFTRMSDAEVLAQLRRASKKTCGRFRANQLDRRLKAPLLVPKVLAQAAPTIMRAALAIGGFGLAVDTASAQIGAPAIVREVGHVEESITGEVASVEGLDGAHPAICGKGADPSVVSNQDSVPPMVMGIVVAYRPVLMGDTVTVPEARTLNQVPPAREGYVWSAGTVIDGFTGETLIGAKILVRGTSTGTITDLDGRYELEIPEGVDSLDVSYAGYESLTTAALGTDIVIALGGGSDGNVIYVGGIHYAATPLQRIRDLAWRVRRGLNGAWERLVAGFSHADNTLDERGGLYQPVPHTSIPPEANEPRLYPNPSSNLVKLQLPGSSEAVLISVYNALGELVLVRPVSEQVQMELQLPNAAAGGTYLVQGTDAEGRIVVSLQWVVVVD